MAGNRYYLFVGLILLILGSSFLIVAGINYFNTKAFLKRATLTRGKVIGFVRGYEEAYNPVVIFKTKSGKTVEFQESFGSNPSPYQKGDEVTVCYDPAMPHQARIYSFWSLWFIPLLFVFVGFIAVLGGTLILVFKPDKSLFEDA